MYGGVNALGIYTLHVWGSRNHPYTWRVKLIDTYSVGYPSNPAIEHAHVCRWSPLHGQSINRYTCCIPLSTSEHCNRQSFLQFVRDSLWLCIYFFILQHAFYFPFYYFICCCYIAILLHSTKHSYNYSELANDILTNLCYISCHTMHIRSYIALYTGSFPTYAWSTFPITIYTPSFCNIIYILHCLKNW